ncbi:hypothetical protein HDU98_004422 [Podochytrium sp. JEL0797]|nr:hypothetical protein HDU98_004422 [Podochytrium sp. JEL0797]
MSTIPQPSPRAPRMLSSGGSASSSKLGKEGSPQSTSRPTSAVFSTMLDIIGVSNKSSPRSSVGNAPSRKPTAKRNDATSSMASALFGDAHIPMVELPKESAKEISRLFTETSHLQATQLYATATREKICIFLKSTRAKVFQVDLTKWDAEGRKQPF